MKPKLGIVGYGFVGKAIEVGFKDYTEILICDPKYLEINKQISLLVANCEFIFIAVPTPYIISENKQDDSILNKCLNEIDDHSNFQEKVQTVIIKSAILATNVNKYIKKYTNLNIVISPEYLTERTYLHDFVNQECMILGGNKKICQQITEFYKNYSICNNKVKIGYCSAVEAAFLKYVENNFLALKVIFLNQMKDIYDKLPINHNYNKFLKNHHLDTRIGVFNFDYTVPGPDGDYGFGGKCLPKDVLSLITESKKLGISSELMSKVWSLNLKYRKNKNWETIEGAVKK